MDNVKGDGFYLKKIVADLKFVIDHTKGMKQTEMEENDLLIDSVMFRIVQVAEKAQNFPKPFVWRIRTSRGLPSAECAIESYTITAS